MALEASAGFNHEQGPVSTTGRSLDAAIRGNGWFVLQAPDGGEALTRNGNFQLAADGTLLGAAGLPVLSDGGPITIPPNAEVLIGSDGTISARQAVGLPRPVENLPDHAPLGIELRLLGHYGPPQPSMLQGRRSQIGAVEEGTGKVGTVQTRAPQRGPRKIRVSAIRPMQRSSSQIRVVETSLRQRSICQIGKSQISPAGINPLQKCPAEVGIA